MKENKIRPPQNLRESINHVRYNFYPVDPFLYIDFDMCVFIDKRCSNRADIDFYENCYRVNSKEFTRKKRADYTKTISDLFITVQWIRKRSGIFPTVKNGHTESEKTLD